MNRRARAFRRTSDVIVQLLALQRQIAMCDLQQKLAVDRVTDKIARLVTADYCRIDLAEKQPNTYADQGLENQPSDASDINNALARYDDLAANLAAVRGLFGMVSHVTATGSRLSAPLKANKKTIGVITVSRAGSAAFTDDDATLFEFASELLNTNLDRYHALAAETTAQLVSAAEQDRLRQANQEKESFYLALRAAQLVAWEWDFVESTIRRFGVVGDLKGRFPSQEPFTVEKLLSRVPEIEREGVKNAILRALAGEDRYFFEYSVLDATGNTRWLRHSGHCDFDDARVPLRVRGVTADITAERTAEIESERVRAVAMDATAREQAALHASELKSTFLANMSHEIRTPLNGVIGMANLLADSKLTDEQQSYARSITVCATNLLAIISDILDLSKAEAGKVVLDTAPLSVRHLVDDVLRVVRHTAESKGLCLSARVAKEVPDTLCGDATRLQQIILNLLSNAIKFTKQGAIHLDLTCSDAAQGAVILHVCVKDDGIGIADDVLPRLFTPFTQADASTTRTFGGTGLGLAISKRLVDLMGGRIGVVSVKGQGSVFHFHVPLRIGEMQADVTTLTPVPALVQAQLRVLVAEDNKINQTVLCKLLEKEHCEVIVVETGVAALRALRQSRFDLVLMDCQMPEMDGFAATTMIRQSADARVAQTPVVALTANAMSGDRERCINAGMNGYISKPVQRSQLIDAINAHVGKMKGT